MLAEEAKQYVPGVSQFKSGCAWLRSSRICSWSSLSHRLYESARKKKSSMDHPQSHNDLKIDSFEIHLRYSFYYSRIFNLKHN